jgi:MFS family permease
MAVCGPALLYSIILALGSLTFGYVMGYTSPTLPRLRKLFLDKYPEDHVIYTIFNAATAVCAMIGPFIVRGLVSPTLPFGRRFTTVIFAVLGIAFWTLMLGTRKSMWIGIASRAGLGVTIGGFSAIIPMYIIELAPPEASGAFGTIPQLFVALGIVITNLVGSPDDPDFWFWNAVVGAGINVLLLIGMLAVPESPAVADPSIIQSAEASQSVCSRRWMAPLAIACAFTIFQQFTGVNAIITNLQELFHGAGIEWKDSYAAALATSAQVIACFVAGPAIAKAGRRVIWGISFAFIAIADIAYGVTQYSSVFPHVPKSVPIIILFVHLFAFGLGAGPIPWFIVAEMFPTVVRASANGVAATCNWLFASIVLLTFPSLEKQFGEWGSFLLFGVISCAGTAFGLVFVTDPKPEESQFHRDIYDDLVSN